MTREIVTQVNDYFKVGNDWRKTFFFDRTSKSSTATAWSAAFKAAELHVKNTTPADALLRGTRQPEHTISVWEKPVESGPWEAASLIGDRAKGGPLLPESDD